MFRWNPIALYTITQELNQYRYNQNRPQIDPDDLDQDGEPDHLTATKHKIDEYIAKQVKGQLAEFSGIFESWKLCFGTWRE